MNTRNAPAKRAAASSSRKSMQRTPRAMTAGITTAPTAAPKSSASAAKSEKQKPKDKPYKADRSDVARMRGLIKAGVIPKMSLRQAEFVLAMQHTNFDIAKSAASIGLSQSWGSRLSREPAVAARLTMMKKEIEQAIKDGMPSAIATRTEALERLTKFGRSFWAKQAIPALALMGEWLHWKEEEEKKGAVSIEAIRAVPRDRRLALLNKWGPDWIRHLDDDTD